MRSLLDQAGAEMIRVVPSNPQRLHQPLRVSLRAPEHAWEEPIPDDWAVQNGGGWGAGRVVLASGLTVQGIAEVQQLLAEAGIGPIVAAAAEDHSPDETLGAVLAETVKVGSGAEEQRRRAGVDRPSYVACTAAAESATLPYAGAPACQCVWHQLPAGVCGEPA